ncbi:hypothetical protein C1645_825257 [Glomus cerebriforme]|uniref:Uncharacterized protein n=1 Tax=Glomus cerebriforme TaxID=658196 RepID=A0A397SSP1_9GLOM|nr:hypothetical protein C1645_825257 [Glomus cerebriforme]
MSIHFKVPPQPKITVKDLLSRNKLPDGNNKRVPCAFIIYRKTLQHELESKGYKLPMPQISTIAAEEESVSQGQSNSVVENVNANVLNNVTTDVNSFVDPYSLPDLSHQNNTPHFETSSFNNFIITEGDNNLEIGNNPIVPEASLVDELREYIIILERRLNLIADLLGIQLL